MVIWIIVAAVGGILSLFGLCIFVRRYLRGEIAGIYLCAVIVAYVSFVSYVLVSTLWPKFASGSVSVVILLPAFVAIVVLIREYLKSKKT